MKKTIGWTLTGMLMFFMAMNFTIDLPVRIDNDVGICITDIDFEMSTPEIEIETIYDFVTDNYFSYEEVGIVSGLNSDLIPKMELNKTYIIFKRKFCDNFNKENYSFINTGKLLRLNSFRSNNTKTNQIAKMHNIESEVNGILLCYNPEIYHIII